MKMIAGMDWISPNVMRLTADRVKLEFTWARVKLVGRACAVRLQSTPCCALLTLMRWDAMKLQVKLVNSRYI